MADVDDDDDMQLMHAENPPEEQAYHARLHAAIWQYFAEPDQLRNLPLLLHQHPVGTLEDAVFEALRYAMLVAVTMTPPVDDGLLVHTLLTQTCAPAKADVLLTFAVRYGLWQTYAAFGSTWLPPNAAELLATANPAWLAALLAEHRLLVLPEACPHLLELVQRPSPELLALLDSRMG